MSDHAIANAQGWMQTIRELCVRLDSEDDEVSESAREEVQQSALSVQVRSDWYAPGTPADEIGAGEYEVLLSTGGPALRIIGDLTSYGEPDGVDLQWQDWGEPWTSLPLTIEDEERVSAFTACFYFGS